MATFHFDLVSPEKLAFSGEVDQVDVPGFEGDFGVLAGHAPVVAAIRPGILTVIAGGTRQKIIVLGGLAEMSDKGLTVLVDRKASLFLIGTVMDYEMKALASGFTFTTPNEKGRCGCGESFHV